jgi:hypothetical protein
MADNRVENTPPSIAPKLEALDSQFKFVTYLIGAMQITAEKDGGGEKRENLDKELRLRNVFPINPVKLEESKTGMSSEEITIKMKGWIASGCWDKFGEQAINIWKGRDYVEANGSLKHVPGDIAYCTMSSWITFRLSSGDQPCIANNTPITMADFSTKMIQDIVPGDKILGFVKRNRKTYLTESTVFETLDRGIKSTVQCLGPNSSVFATPDHPFLTPNTRSGSIYAPVKDIGTCFATDCSPLTLEFIKGWFLGYTQHDGSMINTKHGAALTFLSNKQEEINKVYEVMQKLGLTPTPVKRGGLNYKYWVVGTYKRSDILLVQKWQNELTGKVQLKGWLSGSIDADGYYELESIRYTQAEVHNRNIEQFKKALESIGIKYSLQVRNRKGLFGLRSINATPEYTICMPKSVAFTCPSLLAYKRLNFKYTIDKLQVPITTIPAGKLRVFDLATSTGNFMANGFIVHNCGSYMECGIAMEHGIPIYLITDIPKKELKQSLLQAILVTQGEVFRTENEYLLFIDKKYDLKRKNAD